tara:strand:- start:127 stop:627 length:501 start_codon:yes stop_codon:yes gene_type:complete
MAKDTFTGQWRHTASIIDAPTDSAIALGSATVPVDAQWLITEDTLWAMGPDGVLLGLAIEDHRDVRREYGRFGGERPAIIECHERPWFDREFAAVRWTEDLVATPTALPISVDSIEADGSVGSPGIARSSVSGDVVSMSFPMAYQVTLCADCAPLPVTVEHRFLRL